MPQTGKSENTIQFNYIMGDQLINVKYRDGRKNFKWVLKGAGLVLALILLIKIFVYFDIKDLFLPIVGILIPIGMLYHWYSMSYDEEQKKIVDKLKETNDGI